MKNFLITFSKSNLIAGGLETYINNLYDSLPDIEFEEYSNSHITKYIKKHKHYIEVEEKNNVKYYSIKNRYRPLKYAFGEIESKLKKEKNANIIINNISFFQMLNYRKVCKNNNCIVIDHGGGYFASFKKSKNFWLKLLSFFVIPWKRIRYGRMFKKMTSVTYTKNDVEQIQKYFKFKQFNTIPLFAETDGSFEGIDTSLEAFNSRTDLLFMARFSKQKGISHLKKIIQKTDKNILMAGKGHLEKKMSIKGVTKVGYLETNLEKKEFMSRGKYYIVTSIFEGFSFSVVEALMHGVPIISINSFPAIKFLVGENNERGFIFDSYKKMRNFLKNDFDYDVWKKQSENALQFSKENFNSSSFKNKWHNILNDSKQSKD